MGKFQDKRGIVRCESCSTSFHIKDLDIYPEGRFVRCSVCRHEWLVQQSDVDFAARQSRKRLSWYFAAFPILLLILGCWFLMPMQARQLLSLFPKTFLSETHSVAIHDVRCAVIRPQKSILVSISVRNPSSAVQQMQTVQIIGLGADRRQIVQKTVTLQKSLPAQSFWNFEVELPFKKVQPVRIKIQLKNK